jgi:hypothetical protein
MDAFELGVVAACFDHGVDPSRFHVWEAQAKRASAANGAVGRRLLKRAFAVLVLAGRAKSAAAQHLRLAAALPEWNDHCQELTDDVCRVLRALQPFAKQAFADTLEGAHAALKGGWYAALGAGAGLGSLYWLLARHANQDDADVEATRNQAYYYQDLGREIEDTLRRKYNYTGYQKPDAQRHAPISA